jgi:hypothetical protein
MDQQTPKHSTNATNKQPTNQRESTSNAAGKDTTATSKLSNKSNKHQ